jgi:hypothetical protein
VSRDLPARTRYEKRRKAKMEAYGDARELSLRAQSYGPPCGYTTTERHLGGSGCELQNPVCQRFESPAVSCRPNT